MRLLTGLVAALLFQLTLPALAAPWPTTEFEVFEGTPFRSSESYLEYLAKESAGWAEYETEASVPLTPTLRALIEGMLRDTALLLDRQGFPPPKYDPPVERDDGKRAWRIYYYDFPKEQDDLARYVHDCFDGRDHIAINAGRFTRNGQMTPKSYGDLAHELFHAVQASMPMGRMNCEDAVGDWITEGQAEAFGHDMARQLRGLEINNRKVRWGRRSYAKPLSAADQGDDATDGIDYQSSSFWRYLAERYHLRQSNLSGPQALPGPDLPSNYGTDYSYLLELYQRHITRVNPLGELNWLDAGLRKVFTSKLAIAASGGKAKAKNLRQVYTEFLAVYADYGQYRARGKQSTAAGARTWLEESMATTGSAASCPKVEIDGALRSDVRTTLALGAAATACLEIQTGAMLGPQAWTIQSTASSVALTRQLGMALAGGQQLHLAAVIDAGTTDNPPAIWDFMLRPNQTYFLIVTNMADLPSKTRAQELGLRLTLSRHDASKAPQSSPRRKPSNGAAAKPAPGPRGARDEAAQIRAETQPGPSGPAAVAWSPVEGGDCGKGWRFYCVGGAVIELSLSSGQDAALAIMGVDASGGMLTQNMGFNLMDFIAAEMATEAFDSEPGATVTLRIPGADYGFTGTVADAEIVVSGGDDEPNRFSVPPRPLTRWSPCNYGDPNGTVTIEEFSRTLIRGSFSGKLVRGGGVTRPGRRERCPSRKSAGTASGTFIIAAPWRYDDRQEADYSWLEEAVWSEAGSIVPEGLNLDLPPDTVDDPGATDGADGEIGGSSSGLSDVFEGVDCDCSCQGLSRLETMADRLESGAGTLDEMSQIGLCWMQCAQTWSQCQN